MPVEKKYYEEPKCLLNMHPEVTPIPVRRILDKLDSLLEKKDSDGAERLRRNWISEADAGNDMQGKLTVYNEQIGLYRKLGRENECLSAIDAALSLASQIGAEDSVTGGTTFVNAATGYKAFGRASDALPLYRRAQDVYERLLKDGDDRLAGLYNNMALTLCELGEYAEAEDKYEKAIVILKKAEHREAEIAITYLNLADLTVAREGFEEGAERIEWYLRLAEALLDEESIPRDGYYAFVCEKCAPVFGYYGYFLAEKKFTERAREIYERA